MDSSKKPQPAKDFKAEFQRLARAVSNQKVLNWHKIGPAFWTVTGTLSLAVNIILISLLLSLGRQLFTIKSMVSDQVISGLYTNFVKMDDAHIQTSILVSDTIQVKDSILVNDTIQVNDTIPVVFDLPLKQNTTVKLTKDTPLRHTTIYLNNTAVPLDLVLPKGTELGINLNMTVPVDQKIPITLNVPVQLKVPVQLNVPVHLAVPVDIPLNQTQLHQPFVGLQEVVSPYHNLLTGLPATSQQLPMCGKLTGWLCDWYFQVK